MLIIDQLQKDDARLRVVAVVVLVGLLVLAGGLWRLQVMAAQRYARSEEAQSVRLVRVPAVRGKILDRNGIALAENRPSYDVNLYIEELRSSFVHEYTNQVLPNFRAKVALSPSSSAIPASDSRRWWQFFSRNGKSPRGVARLTTEQRRELQESARVTVYSNTVQSVGQSLGRPLPISSERFLRHYRQDLALPLPVAENLTPTQMALFFERCLGIPGVDLEVQAIRSYPFGSLAAHVLGHLQRADEADNDPDPLVFRYRLRDYQGVAGLEARFDEALRGRAGVKALRVNSQGYRHQESILQPTEPGRSVRLTLDLEIQSAAERALAQVAGSSTRGAAVVMDVRSGDLLALVSAPAFDPNEFLGGMTPEEFARLNDAKLRPQMNRAVSGAYAPGSIFKVIVGLAAMEAGVLNPRESHHYLGYWPLPGNGRSIDDTAPPGDYDFKRAFKRSSNAYFIDHGIKTGRSRIVAMARRFGLGQKSGLPIGPEAPGFLPDDDYVNGLKDRRDPWTEGDTAHLSIGQGALTVTPLQMAVMTAAVANGGHLLEPRLIQEVESGSGEVEPTPPSFPRRDVGVSARHLELIRAAMLADVEESEGTGRESAVPGFGVCGKTGTAEVKQGRILVDKITWFVAFAPYESPRYAVVVVVESGGSGGHTSAPVARKIFEVIRRRETGVPSPPVTPRSSSRAAAGGGVSGGGFQWAMAPTEEGGRR
jgi:penicillin-binding protein 2